MDDRPSGGRKAPVDRTRRTGRLVRRPSQSETNAFQSRHDCASGLVGAAGRSYGPAMTRSLSVAGVALALALLVGCSGPGSTANSSARGGGGSGAAVAPGGAPAAPAAEADRQVVTT